LASSSPRPRAYVFDFDGTLFALPVDWNALRRDLAPVVGARLEGVSIFQAIKEAISLRKELKDKLFAVADAREIPAAEKAVPIDGAVESIRRLSTRSRLALVTMQGTAACNRVLSRYSIKNCFAAVLTREDSLERSEQVLAALAILGVPAGSALFVGDKLNDVIAGRKVGVRVGVVGGVEKQGWGADFLLPDVSALLPPGSIQ
jgi:phosphoglycolate phosphatase-like HAD superfamily hydrolase